MGTLIEQMPEMMDSPPEDEAAQEQPWQNAGTLADNGELVGDGLLSASSTCADQAVIDEALRVGNANIKPERANGLKITRMEKPESIPDMVQEGVKYCRMTAVFNNGMTDGALVGIATPKERWRLLIFSACLKSNSLSRMERRWLFEGGDYRSAP